LIGQGVLQTSAGVSVDDAELSGWVVLSIRLDSFGTERGLPRVQKPLANQQLVVIA